MRMQRSKLATDNRLQQATGNCFMKKIAIIGGGISGLSAAYYFEKARRSVALADPRAVIRMSRPQFTTMLQAVVIPETGKRGRDGENPMAHVTKSVVLGHPSSTRRNSSVTTLRL